MTRFGFASFAVAAVADSDIREIYLQWKQEHGKTFAGPAEEERRFQVFKGTHLKIEEENKKGHSYVLGHNFMSAMTDGERASLLGFHPMKAGLKNTHSFQPSTSGPTSIDWTTEGKVTPVKDQGQCGSSHAFSAVAGLESRWAIHTGQQVVAMSEQELVDCDPQSSAGGCAGGLPENAFEWLKTHDMCTRASYNYTAGGQVGQCRMDGCEVAVPKGSVIRVGQVPYDDDAAMAAAVAEGPVSVGVDSSATAFQMYKSGILRNCGTNADHAVVIVGYDTDYFKVKNSWGASWGESGYIRIGRGNKTLGECGILVDGSYPIFAAKDGSKDGDQFTVFV